MNEMDRAVLSVLGDYTSIATLTSETLANQISGRMRRKAFVDGQDPPPAVSWQAAAQSAGRLVKAGLATRRSLPKQTSFEITDAGRKELGK